MKRKGSIVYGFIVGAILSFSIFSSNMTYARAEVITSPIADEITTTSMAESVLDLKPVTLIIDKTPPQVISINVISESSIGVKFDEEVRLNENNIEILDHEGKKLQELKIYKGQENSFIINLGKSYAESNIVINIINVEDMAIEPNKLDLCTKTLFIPDKTPPNVKKIAKKFLPGSEGMIYIYFNESLSFKGLEKFEFYLHDPYTNTIEKLTQMPEFFKRDSIIMVKLTNEEIDKVNFGYNIFLANIQDKNKNILEEQLILNTSITSYDSLENRPKVDKIEALDKRTVVVTFNQYMDIVDKAAFLVNGAYPDTVQLSENESGNTVATLTARKSKEFNSDLSGKATLRIVVDNNIRLENELGISVELKTFTTSTILAIEDSIPPSLKKINSISSTFGIIDTIVLEYDENIDFTKLSIKTYSVNGRLINRVYTNENGNRGISTFGRFVIIELKPTDTISDNLSSTMKITQLLDIYDMQDNKLSPEAINFVVE